MHRSPARLVPPSCSPPLTTRPTPTRESVRPTPTEKNDCVRVMPTAPRPSNQSASLRPGRSPPSTRRRTSRSSSPAREKRAAAKSRGGTLSTTSLTATKLVPKKKTVSSNESSTSAEARRPPSGPSRVSLADEVGALLQHFEVGGDQTRAAREVLEGHDLVRRVHVAVGRGDEPGGDAGPRELYGVGVGAGR